MVSHMDSPHHTYVYLSDSAWDNCNVSLGDVPLSLENSRSMEGKGVQN